jgi:hypothetical protein
MLTWETIAGRGKEGKILTPNKTVTKSHFHMSGEKKKRKAQCYSFLTWIFQQLNTGDK